MEEKVYSIKEYILFKLDRNIALVGFLTLGIVVICTDAFVELSEQAVSIVEKIITALGVYVGVRTGK